ncbi:MAG: hypothetical protein P8X94_13175 [Woeseiaceae bacterium]
MKKHCVGLAAVVVLASGSALAAGATGSTSFQSLDLDHNGYVSQDEAKTAPELSTNWEAVDVNKDGQIDAAEFSAFEESQPANQQSPSDSATPQD